MDASDIRVFLGAIGCNKIKVSATSVMASCPLSWRHRRGDDHPSFGVKIVPGGTSNYNCFGCKAQGDLAGLLWQLQEVLKRDYTEQLLMLGAGSNDPKERDEQGKDKDRKSVV
jgi:hypothetical protein